MDTYVFPLSNVYITAQTLMLTLNFDTEFFMEGYIKVSKTIPVDDEGG